MYKNKLDKTCFGHDATYSNSKDLAKRAVSDRILRERAYEIPPNAKYDGQQRRLEKMMYTFFEKRSGIKANANEVLAQESDKLVVKNSKEGKCTRSLKIKVVLSL